MLLAKLNRSEAGSKVLLKYLTLDLLEGIGIVISFFAKTCREDNSVAPATWYTTTSSKEVPPPGKEVPL
jgi:hypothetical protein